MFRKLSHVKESLAKGNTGSSVNTRETRSNSLNSESEKRIREEKVSLGESPIFID